MCFSCFVVLECFNGFFEGVKGRLFWFSLAGVRAFEPQARPKPGRFNGFFTSFTFFSGEFGWLVGWLVVFLSWFVCSSDVYDLQLGKDPPGQLPSHHRATRSHSSQSSAAPSPSGDPAELGLSGSKPNDPRTFGQKRQKAKSIKGDKKMKKVQRSSVLSQVSENGWISKQIDACVFFYLDVHLQKNKN